jgi:hypothetical protein
MHGMNKSTRLGFHRRSGRVLHVGHEQVDPASGHAGSAVRCSGDPSLLRRLYVDRGGHCSFSAADELVTLRTLLERIESGRWPDTSPRALSEQVAELGPGYQRVLDFGTFLDAPMAPAFTRFAAPEFLRPSR